MHPVRWTFKVFTGESKFLVGHGNAEECRRSGRQRRFSCVLQAEPDTGSIVRALFAIFSLLICLVATFADDLPVIEDSEAARYVGKKVEVRGFVVSVITSPFATTFINLGREYPNQIFAGFIPVGVKKGGLSGGPARSKGKN